MDGDVAAHRRQDLAEDDVEEPEVQRARSLDIVALLQRQDLSADLTEQARPLDQAQDHREEDEAGRSQDRRDRDEQDQLRQREHHVGDREDRRVDPPADDRRDRSEGDRNDRRDQGGEDRDREDVAAAEHDLVEDILALEIRAERMRGRRGLVDVHEARVVLERHEQWRDERE